MQRNVWDTLKTLDVTLQKLDVMICGRRDGDEAAVQALNDLKRKYFEYLQSRRVGERRFFELKDGSYEGNPSDLDPSLSVCDVSEKNIMADIKYVFGDDQHPYRILIRAPDNYSEPDVSDLQPTVGGKRKADHNPFWIKTFECETADAVFVKLNELFRIGR